MATITFTPVPFRKSFNSMMSSSAHILESTLRAALLDQASAITEDTLDDGDEFLSDLVGYNILSEIALPTPSVVNRTLQFDDSALAEMTDVGSGNTADKILFYTDTGTPATSRVWAIATLSAPISGDDNDDNLTAANGVIRIGPAA